MKSLLGLETMRLQARRLGTSFSTQKMPSVRLCGDMGAGVGVGTMAWVPSGLPCLSALLQGGDTLASLECFYPSYFCLGGCLPVEAAWRSCVYDGQLIGLGQMGPIL